MSMEYGMSLSNMTQVVILCMRSLEQNRPLWRNTVFAVARINQLLQHQALKAMFNNVSTFNNLSYMSLHDISVFD